MIESSDRPGPRGPTDCPTLLAVDVGNTNISLGPFRGTELLGFWRISSQWTRTAEEYLPILREILKEQDLRPADVGHAVIASVVPPILDAVVEALRRWSIPATVIRPDLELGLPIRYEPVSTVGADRIANAVAVRERYGCPAVIVDLGTATTLDVLNPSGSYIGGAIAPGLDTAVEGLAARAFQLPRIQLQAPERAIGSNTVASIQSGIIFGYAGLVDGLVDRFRAEMGGEPVVVATGGLAPVIAPHSRYIRHVWPELTLEGLRLIYGTLSEMS
ncbi:MAG TPA: type III pantothenate kinase [Chloroflexota bacterium]|nr:type III pantothenate kinase [Chloroflexota bacterium]